MKRGLLLKESPEPLHVINCYTCKSIFNNRHDFEQHNRIVHNKRLTIYYEKYESKYSPIGYYETWTKQWVEINGEYDQGRMDVPYPLPTRPKRRICFTNEELENRGKKGICHCGKPVVKPRRKYCSDKCTSDWYNKTIFVNQHRDEFLSKCKGVCEICGKVDRDPHNLEMDHIIAIILGGHPWDERNLQALCKTCHKAKTKSDMKILAWWKRQINYDIGFKTIISDNYQTKL